jgi:hypothetical protein
LNIPRQAFSEAQIKAALLSRLLPAVIRLVKVYPALERNGFTVTLERLASPGNGWCDGSSGQVPVLDTKGKIVEKGEAIKKKGDWWE